MQVILYKIVHRFVLVYFRTCKTREDQLMSDWWYWSFWILFCTLKISFLSRNMVFWWEHQMAFEIIELFFQVLMYCKLPWWPNVHFIKRCMLTHWSELCLHTVRVAMMRMCCFILCFWNGTRFVSWSFAWVLFNIWSKPCILGLNCLYCTTLWAMLHNICTIFEYFVLTHEWDCWNSL